MTAQLHMLFNGRSTGVLEIGLPRPKTLVTSQICASVSSDENNQQYAWNVSVASGALDNNGNKDNNSYVVRALAALDTSVKTGWVEAYMDCCRNKRSSPNCNDYRAANWEWDLWRLIYEVHTRAYKPRPSTCFLVTKPRLREIFAANFRDRIVQHWIAIRLEPLFELRFKSLGDVSHNCRKGFGTKSAVNAVERDIRAVSHNYTKEAWVCKIDVQSFFMSIDIDVMWRLLEPFIRDNHTGTDIDTLLYLAEVTLRNRPTDGCIIKGHQELWASLPASKSMFAAQGHRGLAIGNITSQLEANFYMSYYVEEIMPVISQMGGKIQQYVDDIVFVGPSKESCLLFKAESERILRDKLHLSIHPNKVYIQPASHGVAFVGSVLKPHRRYTGNRTIAGLYCAMKRAENACKQIILSGANANRLRELQCSVSSLNSYLGFLSHTRSYNIRRKLFAGACKEFWAVCYLKNVLIVKIKRDYRYRDFLTQ